jgi:signal transduction histidine kinase
MDGAKDANARARPKWLAAVSLATLLSALLLWSWWPARPAASANVASNEVAMSMAWLTVAMLAGLAGAGMAAWFGLRHAKLQAELRDTRASVQRLDELLDVWQWQTDAQHRLTLLRPPQAAAAAVRPPATTHAPLWEWARPDDEPGLRALLERHAPLHDIEAKLDIPAGQTCRALLRGRTRSDGLGAFAGYAGTLRELGDTAETAAPASNDEASAAGVAAPHGKNAVQAESDQESFSYTVSHDLRAPIRVVEGFTKILKEDYGQALDRVGNDHLDRVLGAAARMNSMVDALLELSKLSSQPLARQPVNLSQLASYVAEDLRRQWPGRDVALHIEPGLQAHGDPTLLRVVLENLLGNAWKYTAKRGAAQVWFERHAKQADCFTVRDNGAGFDMRFSDRLFGVFQRLHSANDFQGTGVGLASVRRIVRRHGGDVWAEAEVDRGASFHFSLPPQAPN